MSRLPHAYDDRYETEESDGVITVYDAGTTVVRGMFRSWDETDDWVADNSARVEYYPLGDAVRDLTDSIGAKRCGGCARRQAAWNKLMKKGRLGRLLEKLFDGPG